MKYTTGSRLKTVADTLYDGNVSELARNLEMTPQALRKYVTGKSMPGGLVLIRLYELGVNINWFLRGNGTILNRPVADIVSEPLDDYLSRLDNDALKEEEQEMLNELTKFSSAIKDLDISGTLRRALLLVYIQHMGKE